MVVKEGGIEWGKEIWTFILNIEIQNDLREKLVLKYYNNIFEEILLIRLVNNQIESDSLH